MTRAEVEQKIRQILTEDFNVPAEAITDDATFQGSFELDSLDVVDFIMLLQKDFGFKSPLESYRELHTFSRVIDFVHRTLTEKAG